MTSKVLIWLPVTIFFASVSHSDAQQPKQTPRIGYLTSGGLSFGPRAFRQGLQALGYIDGKNIVIEYRSAEAKPERISALVNELVQLKVDVIVSTSLPAIKIAHQVTKTIPIVMVASFDPVANGLVDSLARPGGNITGLSTLRRELSGKRLELLKEAVPRLSRVGLLWNPDTPGPQISIKEYEAAARALKISIQSLEVHSPKPDFDGAYRTAIKGRVSGLIVVANSLLHQYQKRVAELAIKHRLPTMNERSDYVEAGGLMSYISDDDENYRRAAYYVDRILKGAKPAELPVEQPTKFEFVVNLKTAKQIGLAIPPNVLARADRVIK